MDRSPWFLRQMTYKFMHSTCLYSPQNNLRLRREVAFTRAHPADFPVRTSRRLSKSRINGETNPPPQRGRFLNNSTTPTYIERISPIYILLISWRPEEGKNPENPRVSWLLAGEPTFKIRGGISLKTHFCVALEVDWRCKTGLLPRRERKMPGEGSGFVRG